MANELYKYEKEKSSRTLIYIHDDIITVVGEDTKGTTAILR